MTERQTSIIGTMLKAYRNICDIPQERIIELSGISKGTMTKLESAARRLNRGKDEDRYAITITMNTCAKLVKGMEMNFHEFLIMLSRFELEKDSELNAKIYFKLSKYILERQKAKKSEE